MNKLLSFILIKILLLQNAFALPTPEGQEATFVTPDGNSFTYYDEDGNPLPFGTKVFLGLDGRGGSILNENGLNTGRMAYDSPENATYWSQRKEQSAQMASMGFVAGPAVVGPVGPNAASSAVVIGSGSAARGDSNASLDLDEDSQVDISQLTEESYNEISFELITLIFGALEIGSKSCKPAGEIIPPSLSSFWKEVKTYSSSEKERDALLNDRVKFIEGKIAALTGPGSGGRELQIEAIQAQIDMVNASIDSLGGTGFYSLDGKASQSRKIARIPLREKLILAAIASQEKNSNENLKTVTAYKEKLIKNGLESALKIAEAACERKTKKLIETCTEEQNNEETAQEKTCTTEEKEVLDPVKGCEIVKKTIPELRTGPVQAYGEIYLIKRIPSREINEKMNKLEQTILTIIQELPKSDDPKFNWNQPLNTGIEEMKIARKESGAICPGNSKENLAKAVAEAVGNNITNPAMLPVGMAQALVPNLVDNAKISNSAISFLTSMGITSEEEAKNTVYPKPLAPGEVAPKIKTAAQIASENFMEAWNLADQIIGQGAYRGDYFKEISSKAKILMALDQKKLNEQLVQKAKLEKYLTDIKKALQKSNGVSGGNKSLANNSSAGQKENSSAVPSAQANETNLNSSGQSATIVATASNYSSNSIAGVNNLDVSSLRVVAPGGPTSPKVDLGYRSTNNRSVVRNPFGISSNALSSAEKNLKNSSKNNKLAKTYLESSVGSKTIEKRDADNSSSFNNKLKNSFDKLKAEQSSKSLIKLAAIATPFSENASDTQALPYSNSDYQISSKLKSGNNFSNYGSNSDDEGYASSSSNTSSKKYKVTEKTTSSQSKENINAKSAEEKNKKALNHSTNNSNNEEKVQNKRILANAIKAKKHKSEELYTTNEDDSLFGRITKAYIRNFEKVNDIEEETEEE
jgi:hypothetical protein